MPDPTREIGRPAMQASIGGGLLPWAAMMDDREYAPDVKWPQSVDTYARMQTDAQLKGLLLATTLPIRRFRWEIDPNGARPEVVAHIAASLNLPIRGQEPEPTRRRRRFSWDKHLAHALRSLAYGHFYFEQVYEYHDPEDGGDGLLHLRKLGTRPPRTITNIMLEDDGGLKGIEQWIGPTAGQGNGLAMQSLAGTVLDRDRLVAYVWDSEDDGDWLGRSMLRACFRNWLVKDRLIRVDATKHERNAMGIPWFEADPAASQAQIDDLAAIATRMRSGEQSGGAGPGKLSIKGVEGSLPDTIGSIREHDHQMSRAFLALFFELGTSETGSRALGSDFIDFFTDSQGTVADFFRDVTQEHQVEDEVELNWGEDEQPPALVYTRDEPAELAFSDLVTGVQAGLIAVDDELGEYIVRRWHLPRGAAATEPPPPPEVPPEDPPAAPPPTPESGTRSPTGPDTRASSELSGPRSKRAEVASRLTAACRSPMTWPDLAREAGTDPKNGTARRARDELVAAGVIVWDTRMVANLLAPAAGIKLPDRELRRQPYPHEVEAKTDFAAMEATFLSSRDALVADVKAAQAAQVDALVAAVEAAAGDPDTLATLSVEPIDTDVVLPHLEDAADAGERQAKAERTAQIGTAAAARPSAAAADGGEVGKVVAGRAKAATQVLAGALGQAASKKASAVAALPPADAAAAVRVHLGGLSDAFLNEQLGGVTMHSYGTGRKEYMKANEPQVIYASELLDDNTCPPCTDEDGTEWKSVEDAEADYPFGGGFVDCEGGLRCRGTLVAEYVGTGGEPSPVDAITESGTGIPLPKPMQPSADIDEVLAGAQAEKQAVRELLDLGEGVQARLNARSLVTDDLDEFEAAAARLSASAGDPVVAIPPLKTRASAIEKLAEKPYGPEGLSDINRASILVGDLDDIPDAVAAVRAEVADRGWTIHEFDNGFATGGVNGYKDLSVVLRSPNGHVAELQFHVNPLWEAKFRGGGHKLYEELRAFTRSGKELTDADRDRMRELAAEMQELYDTALSR